MTESHRHYQLDPGRYIWHTHEHTCAGDFNDLHHHPPAEHDGLRMPSADRVEAPGPPRRPPHPDLSDDVPYQQCGRCGRKTWDTDAFGTEDRMTQPDGFPCGGSFGPETP